MPDLGAGPMWKDCLARVPFAVPDGRRPAARLLTQPARGRTLRSMWGSRLRVTTCVAALLVLDACGVGASTTLLPSGGYALKTVDMSGCASASAVCACGGVGLENTTIEGSPADSRVAWLASPGLPDRSVVFPSGWWARFTPMLEVIDASGHVAFRGGDRVAGACVASDGLLIGWP